MFSLIWHTLFFNPIYNGLIFLIDVVPGGDVGVAIILLTIIVKVLLLPLSLKAARTQHAMQELEPKLTECKERNKNDREAYAREMMLLYKAHGVNPFASIALLFIQIPIIIALYLSVYSGGGVRLPDINTALLYSFVAVPVTANMLFVGIVDMAARSLPLAFLAGGTQFVQAWFSMPKLPTRNKDKAPTLREDFARSMQLQMRYVMPVIIFFVAYSISASVALYFTVSNVLGILQELVVRRERKKLAEKTTVN